MVEVIGSVRQYPARASFLTYLTVIALGTVALCLPICGADGAHITVMDGLFTATSATCVTGLTVRSTGNDFSFVGQLVILLMIQIGGMGILTITTFVAFNVGARAGLRERAIVAETLGAQGGDLLSILRSVALMTLFFEGVGFLLLAARNLFEMPVGLALWHALFHSISAYCNAGFGLWDDSLTRYRGDLIVNFTICSLVIIGGLGVPVLIDIRRTASGPLSERWRKLHLHSKFMLLGSFVLLASGTISILVLEWDGVFANYSLKDSLLAAFFQSVVTRTAGFNTIEINALSNATLYIMTLLMIVGAGPCSTAGGFKVSTLFVIAARGWSSLRGYLRVNVFGRTLSEEIVNRAIATAMMFAVVSVCGLTTLLMLEQSGMSHSQLGGPFLDAVFEIVSALGTVGLSTGLTTKLTAAGRWIIILLMFIGRLGPVGVGIAVSRAQRSSAVELPQEDPLVG